MRLVVDNRRYGEAIDHYASVRRAERARDYEHPCRAGCDRSVAKVEQGEAFGEPGAPWQ